jgi:hypothetical protein
LRQSSSLEQEARQARPPIAVLVRSLHTEPEGQVLEAQVAEQ